MTFMFVCSATINLLLQQLGGDVDFMRNIHIYIILVEMVTNGC